MSKHRHHSQGSQLVTLFTTPVIYLWLDRIQARRKAPAEGRLEAGQVASETV